MKRVPPSSKSGSPAPTRGDVPEQPASLGEPFHLEWLHGPLAPLDCTRIEQLIRRAGSVAAFWQACDRVDWLLAVLNGASEDGKLAGDVDPALRRFACWCAVEAGADATDLVMVYATALAEGRTPPRAITRSRNSRRDWLACAGVQGLPRCIPVAARSLAAWHAGADDASVGAWWAAHYAVEAKVFAEAEAQAAHWRCPQDRGEPWRVTWHTAAWLRAHPVEADRIRTVARARLAKGLRFLIPAPFDPQVQ